MKRVTMLIPQELYDAVKAAAKTNYQSVSGFVRHLLVESVNAGKKK